MPLSGIRLPYGTTGSLIDPDDDVLSSTKTWWVDAQTIYATFDLTDADVGLYDVRIETPDGRTSRLDEVLDVVVGTGPRLEARLVAPDVVWSGGQIDPIYRMFEILVEYTNVGDADIPAPYFVVATSPDIPVSLYADQSPSVGTLEFLGINQNGPAGILPPGTRSRVPFYSDNTPVYESPDAGAFLFDYEIYVLPPSDTEMNWSELAISSRPENVDENGWAALWNNLAAGVGDTWADYLDMLSDNATYLGILGQETYDIDELFAFEMRQANSELLGRTLAYGLDTHWPAPGMDLLFGHVFAQPLLSRYNLGPLGRGWSHNWEIAVEELADGDVMVAGPAGASRLFKLADDGSYTAAQGDYGTLTFELGRYYLTEKDGTVTTFRTDWALDYIEDTNGNRITAGYTSGRLTSLTHSNGDALVIEYDGDGRIQRVTDPAGRTAEYAYDPSGEHLLSVTTPDGTTSYTYAADTTGPKAHTLESIAYPGGTHVYFEYDDQGRLTRQYRDGEAEEISFSYDTAGEVYLTDAAGAITTLLINDVGQIGQLHDPLDRSMRLFYDSDYNLAELVQPDGVSYLFGHDARGNLTGRLDPLGYQIDLAYDPMLSRLTSVSDQRGNVTEYSYDQQGNLLAITYADDTAENFEYDPLGNLVEWENRRGNATPGVDDDHVVAYTYNDDAQLTRKEYTDGSQVDFTYDSHGNLTSATDAHGTTAMQYDTADRLTRITYPSGRYLAFSYDAGGRRTQSVDQDGFTLDYQYDAVGRLAALTDGEGDPIVTYTYDAVGRLVREDKGNETYTTYDYDAASQLLHLVNYAPDDSVLSRFDYAYDTLGQRTSMNTDYGLWTYEYDATGQLIHAVLDSTDPGIPAQDLTYVYDAAGNRIRTVENGVITEYVTNNMNQYTVVGAATYEYDADGNLVSKVDGADTWTYTYNDENRLTDALTPEGAWTYEYDAFGNRVSTIEGGAETQYVIDPIGYGDVVAEHDGTGRLIARYTHGLGLERRSDGAGAPAYYTFDALGSTSELTGPLGALVNAYAFDPFGASLSQVETVANPFQYVGEYGVMHEGNGLEFMRARFYDPSLGRFTCEDPIGIAGGDVNLVRYVGNDVVDVADPTGLWPEDPLTGVLLGALKGLAEVEKKSPGTVKDLIEGVGQAKKAAEHKKKTGWGGLHPGSRGWEEIFDEAPPTEPAGEDSATIPAPPDEQPTKPVAKKPVRLVKSGSPEEKFGPAGFGEQNFVAADELMSYRVTFWNKPDATAPAKVVEIYDQLDDDLDWRTFRLDEIAPLPDVISEEGEGRTHYHGLVNLGTEHNNILVEVDAGLDITTGQVHWIFTTLDPETGEQIENPLGGFLAPNDEDDSFVGFVTYTVRTKKTAPSGAEIPNFAEVIFDLDPPNLTETVFNTIDSGAPTSEVADLPATSDATEFLVTWSGVDDTQGSGLTDYDVYVSIDGGLSETWQERTALIEATYTGERGHTYAFYSIAHDNVGNRESAPDTPDTQTTVADHIAPTVEQVLVRGSAWDDTFWAYLESQGLGNENGYRIPVGSSAQLDTLPWTNVDTLTIVFSEDIVVDQDDLALWSVNVLDYVSEVGFATVDGFTYDAATFTATWKLAAPITADKLLIDLDGDMGGVTDIAGNLLDGEWEDTTSTFPSGDAAAGGDFQFRFNILPGDVDRNGMTIINDLILVRNSLSQTPVDTGYSIFKDMDGSGQILINDMILVRNRLTTALPEGEPSVPEPVGSFATVATPPVDDSFTGINIGATKDDETAQSTDTSETVAETEAVVADEETAVVEVPPASEVVAVTEGDEEIVVTDVVPEILSDPATADSDAELSTAEDVVELDQGTVVAVLPIDGIDDTVATVVDVVTPVVEIHTDVIISGEVPVAQVKEETVVHVETTTPAPLPSLSRPIVLRSRLSAAAVDLALAGLVERIDRPDDDDGSGWSRWKNRYRPSRLARELVEYNNPKEQVQAVKQVMREYRVEQPALLSEGFSTMQRLRQRSWSGLQDAQVEASLPELSLESELGKKILVGDDMNPIRSGVFGARNGRRIV